MSDLLVAGAVALDDLTWNGEVAVDQLGGSGFHAAAAAAPFARTQLWARAGRDLTHPMRRVFADRGIHTEGVSHDGPTPRWRGGRFIGGDVLGPTVPGGEVGALLLADLPAGEDAALEALQGVAAPVRIAWFGRRRCAGEPVWVRRVLATAQVALLPADAAMAMTATTDPLAAAEAVRAWGPEAVLLMAGPLGGLMSYQGKATTWCALPVPCQDPTGVSGAFAGAVAGWLASGRLDFTALKRAAENASAMAGIAAGGLGSRKVLATGREACLERASRLRRAAKP